MPPRSRATGFDRLAPDQRAAVELVLRHDRSYGELADMLGMPEETIRARARSGLAALAPDLPAPARASEIADWLLGQQPERHAARTRELLLSDPSAQRWTATVAAPLRGAPGGERVPALPTGTEPPEPRVNGKSTRAAGGEAAHEAEASDASGVFAAAGLGRDAAPARRRPTRRDGAEAAARPGDGAPPREAAPRDEAGAPGRSSRLGGAILLGAAVVLVGVVLAFVLTRGGDDDPGTPTAATPAPTATATAASIGANDILLRGPAGSSAVGLMRLFEANDGTVRFALAAQGVAANQDGERYSLWFRKKNGDARLLGDVKDPVTKSGELTSAGPGNEDVEAFPQWFATYDSVLVTQDAEGARKPGKVILSGDLPHSQSG